MFLNKVAGALLAVLLVLLALPTLSDIIFGKGGHHGGHHEEEAHSLNERFAASYAYYLPVEEGAGGAEVEEEVFDKIYFITVFTVLRGNHPHLEQQNVGRVHIVNYFPY